MPHITPSDIGTFLNLTINAAGQSLLTPVIAGIEAYFERECNRKWGVSEQQVEHFDGGRSIYFPKYTPINTVASITDDGSNLTADTDYFVYATYIRLATPAVNQARGLVITYTPSTPIPADVKHAMVRWAAQIFKEHKDAGKVVSRVNMANAASVEFLAKDGVPKYVEEVIRGNRLPPRR